MEHPLYAQHPHHPGLSPMAGMAPWPGMVPGHPAAIYYAQPPYPPPPAPTGLFNDRFVKGLLLGAAATYLLTNEHVQRAAIKGAVRVWTLLQGGVEELKERFLDAEAEIRAEQGI
ncbi:MAG: hypothetical protein RMN53_17265 [Anaerolineae bacterium]|nr:hypothetical protein [Anaerolineae bacterium]